MPAVAVFLFGSGFCLRLGPLLPDCGTHGEKTKHIDDICPCGGSPCRKFGILFGFCVSVAFDSSSKVELHPFSLSDHFFVQKTAGVGRPFLHMFMKSIPGKVFHRRHPSLFCVPWCFVLLDCPLSCLCAHSVCLCLVGDFLDRHVETCCSPLRGQIEQF